MECKAMTTVHEIYETLLELENCSLHNQHTRAYATRIIIYRILELATCSQPNISGKKMFNMQHKCNYSTNANTNKNCAVSIFGHLVMQVIRAPKFFSDNSRLAD